MLHDSSRRTPRIASRYFTLLFGLLLGGATIAQAQVSTQAPAWRWAVNTGSTVMGQTTAEKTVVTAQGDVFVLGTFDGSVTFGADTFQPTLGPYPAFGGDVFLTKYDSVGQLQWARQIGGNSMEYAAALATDAQGNAYVGVDFASTELVLAGSTLINQGGDSTLGSDEFTDVLLAKINSAGQWQWARQLGGDDSDYIGGLAVDGAGSIYVAGSLFEPGTLGTFPVAGDSYVGKLDGTGQWLWAASGGSVAPSGAGAYALALNPTGTSVYVAGQFADAGQFGTTALTAAVVNGQYDYDGYVGALSAATGQWQWARGITGDGYEAGTALATDSAGNVALAGVFDGSEAVLDTTTLLSPDPTSLNFTVNTFVAKLSGAGQWLWVNGALSLNYNGATGVAVHPSGDVYVTGVASDSAFFGPTSMGWDLSDFNTYLARLDGPTGAWQWAIQANDVAACGCGHPSTQYSSIAVDAAGTLRLASTYTDSARFGGIDLVGPLFFSNGSGQQQGYVARFIDVLPVVQRLSPAIGMIGSTVTLTGQRFSGATQVLFNGVPATFSIVSPTRITVTVPAGATTGIVQVVTPAGTVNSPVVFRVGPNGLTEAGARAFALYPNPAHGTAHLTLAAPGAATAVLVLDGLGRVVRRQVLAASQAEVTVSLTGLPAGLYSVRVGDAVRKLIVE